MKYEYKDLTNRKTRDKTLELVYELPHYVQTFLIGREAKMSTQTQFIYISRINLFFDYLTKTKWKEKEKKEITLKDLSTLTTEDIEAFSSYIRHKGKKDCKETTINSYLSALQVFFKYFVTRGKLPFNPVNGVERGKREKHGVIRLNNDQKDDFFKCIENGDMLTEHQKAYHERCALRDMAICLLLVRTGLRVSELVGLNLEDIHFDNCSLSVLRKGNKYDTVFFDDEVADVLMEYLETREGDTNAVFLVSGGAHKGERLSVRSVERMVKKYATSSTGDNKITPHKLRATYATDMLQATNNISLVQKALNHESPTTTMFYVDQRVIDLENARNTLVSKKRKRKPK